MVIAIDFDGTMVKHKYPAVGEELPNAVDTMLELQRLGHKLILFTMRSGKELTDAVNWCKSKGIELYGINENPTQASWTASRKVYAELYIDDAALGCPLKWTYERPEVHWMAVRRQLVERGIIERI